jgi:lantibiotic modifying enzyme
VKPSVWRPLLDGDLTIRAWEAVHAVTQALEAWSPGDPREYHPDVWADRVLSLGGGPPGQALFHGYLFRATGAEHHAGRARQLLDQAVEALAAAPTPPALYSGFTGVAWAVEHLDRLLDGEDEQEADGVADEDMGEEIDRALLTALDRFSWTGDYDLMSGLAGFGVYALERFPRPLAARCLEAVVDRLDESAERNGQGVTWFRPPEVLSGASQERAPSGYYDLGVAHGVPGVIALLAAACRLGIRQYRARPLLDGAVRWLARQPLTGQRGACYPARVGPGIEAKPSRLAWCYGDPGIAATLLYAARAVGMKEWEEMALAIAAHAAGAAPEDAGAQGPGLCHGALGLAHLYNRVYQAGGGGLFAEAARRWYRLGLEMLAPEKGGEDWRSVWASDAGFLTGAAGVGLALLAAITPVEPEWDRLLLVAIPSGPASG